jgi:SAM-dependent methyltransferase
MNHVRAALEPFAAFEIFVSPPSHKLGIEGIVECSNLLIEKTLAGDWDYLWIVQGDVEVPREAFYRFYMLDVDVAQGVVRRHDGDGLICGFMDEKAKVWYLPRNAVEGMVLSGWVFAGMSCTLIKRRVLEAGVRFRYLPGVGEDILFMYDVQSRGFVAKVHGDVLCGHLPEWALEPFKPKLLDVGCGHRPRGDVNVDLFPDPSAHRCVNQRVNDDVALKVHEIPNFVKADACHLPFRDGVFEGSYSWHLIEHVQDPNLFLSEILRVSAEKVEVRCPNGEYLSCRAETKPLHLHDFSLDWFRETLKAYHDWDFSFRWDYSQSEPWEIVVEGYRKDLA